MRIFQKTARTAVMLLFLFLTPNMMLWAQEANKKFAWTTQMFLNEQRENALHPEKAARRTQARRVPGSTKVLKQHRLIADPDTVGGVVYISCFIHLADASALSEVEALGVEVEETFDGLDFITARVPVNQLEALADIDNVTRIKVAQRMRPLTDKAREATNVDDLLTQSPDAIAQGVTTKYDGSGVVLGIIDCGIDFQHIAFKDKDGNSRIKRAYVYNGSTAKEYSTITSTAPTTDDKSEDHGTHTSTTAGGSSVIINGTTVTVTDDHANATYGGMAPGADLYLAGIKGLNDTYLINALKKMVTYADSEGKPLVVSNSWGSSWGPRDGTGEWADLVGTYFGDSHPNRVILFAASNDAGHKNGNEGGGYFVKKSSVSSSSPLGTIIRTDGEGGDYYTGLIACAWNATNATKLNCKLHVLNKTGAIQKSWTVSSNETSSFSGLSTYYSGSMTVYIEQENGKYCLAVYSEEGLESKSNGKYTLAIEVYPASGSANVNMWAGDLSFFTDNYTTSGHTWLDGTDDMCVADEATIPDAIAIGAYATKKSWKDSNGTTRSSSDYTVGDIAYFSSYATAEQSPTGEAYPWISAPGARLAAGVNHYHTASVDEYSYYGSDYNSDLVVNSSTSPYAMMEGTSMATPVAAGIVALWLQAAQEVDMDLTVNDVKEIMAQTAIQDSYTQGTNAAHFGKGKIDALAGIQHILGTVGGPFIKVTPKDIDFADKNPYATRTYTKTFTVKGLNLEGDITVTLNDANGVYTLSQTSITQTAAAAGAEITITYSPLTAGTHNATITLSSANATDAVVNLTATAKPATPTIIADPEALSFTAEPDAPKSLNIDVISEFLEGNITVTLNDANSVFTIDRTTVTKDESEEGATLTVTFQSANTGTFNGTVTLSSAGAENVVISLTATAALMMDETVDFAAKNYSNGEAVESVLGTNCTITFDKGTNSNVPKYYDTGTAIRLYASNTMTVASTSKTIVGIALTFGSGDGSNAITTNVGAYSNGTWTGSASSVTFTVNGTTGHRRIQKVTVTFAGGDTPTPVDPTLTYYKKADGMQGEALKTAMCSIIYNRTEKSYDYLWTAFQSTDVKSNGKIWDMYSNITDYTPVTSGSTYSKEGDCYNREHSFPQSWFGSNTPMNTDLHHIYPTDGFVNGKRANYPFGETNGNEYKSANDFSKLGTCTYPGYTGIVFEPADEYKGDFARTYFYMVTCYEEKLPDWYSNNSESRSTLDGSTYPGLQTWQLNMLMEWAKNDPVSEKETSRNNAVYAIQKNRNPFIDYPGLEEYVWGSMTTTAFSYDNYVVPTALPITVPTLAVNEGEVTNASAPVTWNTCDGVTEYTLQLATDNQFSTGTSTEATLINESFESNSIPTGWTKSSNVSVVSGKSGDGTFCVAFKGAGAYLITPLLDNPSNISFIYKRSSNTTSWGLDVSYSTSANGPWTNLETISGAITSWQTFSQEIGDVGSVYIKLTDTRSSGGAERYIDLIQITGTEPSGNGSLISTTAVNGTSYTFTGLDPETTYYARVKGNAEWSNVVSFTTRGATLVLNDDDDNTDAISAAATSGKKYDVTLSGRTLYKDNNWNTLCLPFYIDNLSGTILEGATVMELGNSGTCNTGFDAASGTLTLDFVDASSIEAGHAYIVKWTTTGDPIENPVFAGVTISNEEPSDQKVVSADGKVQFIGTYSPAVLDNTDPGYLFIGSNNTLHTPQSEGYTVKSFRAFFHVNLDGSEVKAYVLHFNGESPTPVTTPRVEREGSDVSTWYDLQGRKYSDKPTAKGVYISKGRKVVVK